MAVILNAVVLNPFYRTGDCALHENLLSGDKTSQGRSQHWLGQCLGAFNGLATSRFLSKCWPSSMKTYDVIRWKWININAQIKINSFACFARVLLTTSIYVYIYQVYIQQGIFVKHQYYKTHTRQLMRTQRSNYGQHLKRLMVVSGSILTGDMEKRTMIECSYWCFFD